MCVALHENRFYRFYHFYQLCHPFTGFTKNAVKQNQQREEMKTIKNYKPRRYSDTPIAYFHFLDECNLSHQGIILSLSSDRSGIVAFFEWDSGLPMEENVYVNKGFFDNCTFYDTVDEWRFAVSSYVCTAQNSQTMAN